MMQIKTRVLAALAVALLFPSSHSLAQEAAQPKLPVVTLSAGMHLVQAEMASSPLQRQTGMMFRRQMAQNEGMLFVFEQAQPLCFWMRNTFLPLSIAFIADDGTIINTADMKPHDESSHCSKQPARYALEVNQGWFDKRGLKSGARFQGGPFSAAAAKRP